MLYQNWLRALNTVGTKSTFLEGSSLPILHFITRNPMDVSLSPEMTQFLPTYSLSAWAQVFLVKRILKANLSQSVWERKHFILTQGHRQNLFIWSKWWHFRVRKVWKWRSLREIKVQLLSPYFTFRKRNQSSWIVWLCYAAEEGLWFPTRYCNLCAAFSLVRLL